MAKEQDLFRFREKNNLKLLIFDVESESLSLFMSRPWTLAWLVVENGQIKEEYDKYPLIKDLNISRDAARITRFNYNDYKNKAEDPDKVYSLLEKYLFNEEYYIVGSNLLSFDIFQIKNLQKYLGKKVDYSYISRIYDTKCLGYAMALGEKFPEQKQDILPWMFGLSQFRQKGIRGSNEFLAKTFNIEYDKELAHGARFDVGLSWAIFKQLIWRLEIH